MSKVFTVWMVLLMFFELFTAYQLTFNPDKVYINSPLIGTHQAYKTAILDPAMVHLSPLLNIMTVTNKF
jgi:hypothetical protein